MLATYDGMLGFQRCRVYLEDDRIEVGKLGFAYVEDLSRATYRDVHAVTFAPGRFVPRLAGGAVLVAGAGILVVVALATGGEAAGIVVAVAAALLAAGGAAIWWGAKGATLRFRVETVHGFVSGAVAGRRSTRERFRAALLERIAEAKRRATAGA